MAQMSLKEYFQTDQDTLEKTTKGFADLYSLAQVELNSFTTLFSDIPVQLPSGSVEDAAGPLAHHLLLAMSARHFAGALSSVLRGHTDFFVPVLRSAVEAAAYASKIQRHPQLGVVWINRRHDEAKFDKKFRPIEIKLFGHESLHNLWRDYQLLSQYGTHGNPESTYTLSQMEKGGMAMTFGCTDPGSVAMWLMYICRVGERMLKDVYLPIGKHERKVLPAELLRLENQMQTEMSQCLPRYKQLYETRKTQRGQKS